MMKQEPTEAAHSAAVGIPVVHGREDVNQQLQPRQQPPLTTLSSDSDSQPASDDTGL